MCQVYDLFFLLEQIPVNFVEENLNNQIFVFYLNNKLYFVINYYHMPGMGFIIATLSTVADCTFIIAKNTCRFATISVLWKK